MQSFDSRTRALFLAALAALFGLSARPVFDAFEVATVRPAAAEPAGRFIKMQSAHRFIAKNYTLQLLIAAAYNLSPQAISGGPKWIDSEKFDILAGTPNSIRPNLDEQMTMLRKLLSDRFELKIHREPKTMSIFLLTLAKSGPKLKESTLPPDELPDLINVLYPDHVMLPARNATIAQFASMLQRAVLDRPVVDRTGLTGRYDFDLEWSPDESQFGGNGPKPGLDVTRPSLYAALQSELGLKLEATKGPVEAIVIDRASKPSDN